MNENGKQFKFAKQIKSSIIMPSADPKESIALALSGNTSSFHGFLILHPDMVNAKEDVHGTVPLHVAASKNNIDIIELLVRYSANLDIQDVWGNTPLLYAVDRGRLEAVSTLLKHGAKVNKPDFRGNTPLHSACRTGNLEIVRTLLKHNADPDAFDYSNMKPVQKARNYDVVEAIELEINRRKNTQANSQQLVNWVGMGIGLGVGIGIAFAKQQHIFSEHGRVEDERKRLEEEKAAALIRKNRQMQMRKQSLLAIQGHLNKK